MPRRRSSVSVISATRTSINTWRGWRSSCLMVASISGQFRGKVVTMTELVVSSGMKRIWPSMSPSSPMGATGPPGGAPGAADGGGGGGGVYGAASPGRRGVEGVGVDPGRRSEEHTSELQSLAYLVCRLLL